MYPPLISHIKILVMVLKLSELNHSLSIRDIHAIVYHMRCVVWLPCWISSISMLVEHYKVQSLTAFRRMVGEIVGALEGMLAAVELELEDADVVSAVLQEYESNAADFADLMIVSASRKNGAFPLMTFDAKAARLNGVELVN